MDSLSNNRGINMDGSNDAFFRYKMPAIQVKHEGKGKMRKSVLVNIKEVCEKIGRPADYLMTYLGQKLSATAKVEKDISLSYVTGHHDPGQVQVQVLKFIQDTVMCLKCRNPETSCHTEGSKKRQVFFLLCKGCGERSDLDTTDRFVKYMITHHADDAAYGHAACTANATATAAEKKECPKCHHKTSKPTCSKCGVSINAVEAMLDATPAVKFEQSTNSASADRADHKTEGKKKDCPACHHKTSKPFCSKCGAHIQEKCDMVQETLVTNDDTQDFVGTVRLWMVRMHDPCSHGEISLDDFIVHLKTKGFQQSTPLEQLGAVVQVIAGSVGNLLATDTAQLQPIAVAKHAKPFIAIWSDLMEELSGMVADTCAVVDIVIGKAGEGITCALPPEALMPNGDCAIVGLLLALHDVKAVADGLLEGCHRLDEPSTAMSKFMNFLAEEPDDDESEEEDVEEKVENHCGM